jgi:hypothetical protein
MAVLLEANAATGFTAGLDLLPVALRSLRTRVLEAYENLEPHEWRLQSRCELWSVHDVVRHVRDACRIHVASLCRQPTPFSSGDPFDTRETPRRWLERTADQSPEDTLDELRGCCAVEEAALAARVADPTDEVVGGPYGQIHWSVLSAHVFWDAWLHDRDVTEVLARGGPSTPAEDPVAAFYSLLIASMPAVRVKHHFALSVALAGGDGTGYAASVVPGRVSLRDGEAPDGCDLGGELGAVADALAGRGPELELVLHGEPSLLEPLTWLRARLLPVA